MGLVDFLRECGNVEIGRIFLVDSAQIAYDFIDAVE